MVPVRIADSLTRRCYQGYRPQYNRFPTEAAGLVRKWSQFVLCWGAYLDLLMWFLVLGLLWVLGSEIYPGTLKGATLVGAVCLWNSYLLP